MKPDTFYDLDRESPHDIGGVVYRRVFAARDTWGVVRVTARPRHGTIGAVRGGGRGGARGVGGRGTRFGAEPGF